MKKERRWARIREVDIDSKKNVFSSRRDCVGIVSALIPGSSQRSSTGIALRILNPFILKTIIVKPVKLVGLFI